MVSEKSNGLGDYLDRLAARALGRIPRAQPAIGDHSYGSYPRPIGEDWEPEPMTARPGQEDQSQRDPAAAITYVDSAMKRGPDLEVQQQSWVDIVRAQLEQRNNP